MAYIKITNARHFFFFYFLNYNKTGYRLVVSFKAKEIE